LYAPEIKGIFTLKQNRNPGLKMSKNKISGSLTVIFFTLLILCGTAAADELELKLFKRNAKASPQLTQAQPSQYTRIKFGLRIMGGCALFWRNDINEGLQGAKDCFDDLALKWGNREDVDSEVELVNMGLDFSGELFINFTPNLGIAIGAGYISGSGGLDLRESNADRTDQWKFSAIPITLTCYYGIPLGSMMGIVFNAGLGYYLGRVNYDYFYGYYDGTWEDTKTWSAKSNSLGFHGGINFEFGFTSNLAFVIGARGRYAKLTDLTGDLDWVHYDSWSGWSSGTEKDQALWFGIHMGTLTNKDYPDMRFSEDNPSHKAYYDVHKAEINLSGIIFQAGIKVTF
jgi:hypothetical protein